MFNSKIDYHLHTDFSADSEIKLSELVQTAINNGYESIAITEHMHLLPQEIAVWGIPSMSKYKASIDVVRNQHPTLKIIYGIEIGDFQKVKQLADAIIEEAKFELILGAVHFVNTHTNISIPFDAPLNQQEVNDYYEQNLLLVETCDIDILAHLGVYKRYYKSLPDESQALSLIQKIFTTIIAKGIALEFNYSSFRKTYQSLLPEPAYLELYKAMGGVLVSIGSDSHRIEHFGDHLNLAQKAVDTYGFEIVQTRRSY